MLAVLALLLVLILSLRLRVSLSAKDGALTAEVRAGPVRYRLYPPPERKPPKASGKPEPKPSAPKQKRSPDVKRILRIVRRLWNPVLEALRNVRGAVRVDPLTLRVTYGGRNEPADAAVLCGDTLALVWAVMPTLERLCRIPRPCIRVDTDFDAPDLRLEADVGLTLRVWALLFSLRPLLKALRKEDK